MNTIEVFCGVSFARTPFAEISAKAAQIEALGWTHDDETRGNPWVATFSKSFPMDESTDHEAEIRAVMGDYWIDADGIRSLLDK